MEGTKLIAKKRDLQGSSNSRRLRKEGALPAIIYGEGEEATPIQIDTHIFTQLLHHHTSETMLIELELDGTSITTLIKEVQHHPVSYNVLHVDFLKISADKPIQVDIQVSAIGDAEGVQAGGVLDLVMHTIGIECLPAQLQETIEVDVTNVELGSSLTIGDLTLPKGWVALDPADAIVISVATPRAEVEEDDDELAEPEVLTEKKASDD